MSLNRRKEAPNNVRNDFFTVSLVQPHRGARRAALAHGRCRRINALRIEEGQHIAATADEKLGEVLGAVVEHHHIQPLTPAARGVRQGKPDSRAQPDTLLSHRKSGGSGRGDHLPFIFFTGNIFGL